MKKRDEIVIREYKVYYSPDNTCAIEEHIRKTQYKMFGDTAGFFSEAKLLVHGATISGRVWTEADILVGSATALITASGEEVHEFHVWKSSSTCTIKECKIPVTCEAWGGFTGSLEDAPMDASGLADLHICGKNLQFGLDLDPNAQPATKEGEIILDNHKFKYEIKTIRPKVGVNHLPRLVSLEELSCTRTLPEVKSSTQVSLAATNRDATLDRAIMNVDITNRIESKNAIIRCTCSDKKVNVKKKREKEKWKKQKRELRILSKKLKKRTNELRKKKRKLKRLHKKKGISENTKTGKTMSKRYMNFLKNYKKVHEELEIADLDLKGINAILRDANNGFIIYDEDFEKIKKIYQSSVT